MGSDSQPILPGATLGVLGGGQLGRMFTIAARQMGYRVHVFVPEEDSPTGQVADLEVVASYDDLDAVARFAAGVSVVTFEFENVSAAAAEAAARHAPVRPGGHVLHTTQHRLREKTFLRDHGLPVTPFAVVRSEADLAAALDRLGLPAVLKTASWGYDGKGQAMLRKREDAAAAWASLKTDEAVLEAFIDFECEVSVVSARGLDGQVVHYGPMRNTHVHHILDLTVLPAEVADATAQQAQELAGAVMRELEVVGVLCTEFFVRRDGSLLINELAPRPHNSGHITMDACVTSQFEQQVRAICGLPLGSTRLRDGGGAAMANLLGDLWQAGEPDWASALADPDLKLHLYGKAEARRSRKMGHMNLAATTPGEAVTRVLAARDRLTGQVAPAKPLRSA